MQLLHWLESRVVAIIGKSAQPNFGVVCVAAPSPILGTSSVPTRIAFPAYIKIRIFKE